MGIERSNDKFFAWFHMSDELDGDMAGFDQHRVPRGRSLRARRDAIWTSWNRDKFRVPPMPPAGITAWDSVRESMGAISLH